MEKAIFNWSGGKDSAFCLSKVFSEKKYTIESLLTTISKDHQRISMHGVREELLDAQAQSIGIPVKKIGLTESADLAEYENQLTLALNGFKKEGITYSVFGDIFLEDLRKYREEQLAKLGFKAIFPLWNYNTFELAKDFINSGFKSIVVCVDEKKLDRTFSGRIFDMSFINDLPRDVDPCGENGEFHTFVFDGPVFKNPVPLNKGEIVYKKYKTQNGELYNTGFFYFELLPGN
jgi:uncharacterized protein (TIGR00290 family)